MAQGYKSDKGYDYEDDYFLNGDSKFDQMFDNLTSMYKTYIHADDFGRQQIDQTLRSNGPNNMRELYRGLGEDFGVANLDQRIAVFNDKDHPFTDADLKQQEQFRQDIYNAYVALPDAEKVRCFEGLQRCRDEVDLSVGLSSSQIDLEGLGLPRQEFDSPLMSPRDSSSKGNVDTTLEQSHVYDENDVLKSRYELLKPNLDAEWYDRQGLGKKLDTPSFDSAQSFVTSVNGNSVQDDMSSKPTVRINEFGEIIRDVPQQGDLVFRGERSEPKHLPNFDGKIPDASTMPWISKDKQVDTLGSEKNHSKSLKEIITEIGESKSSSVADALKNKTADDVVAKREQRVSQATNLFSELVKKPSKESDFDIEK